MVTKKSSAKKTNGNSFEHIRIAPIHHPKAKVALSELGKNKEDSELFDGHPHAASSNAHLTYMGGPLLTNVKVYTIFWGKNWKSKSAFISLKNKVNDFFKTILVSSLIDQLHEYSRPGKTIGHGSLIGTKTISTNVPAGSISDTAIQAQLKSWISSHTVPANSPNTPNTLYFIYTDIHVKIIMGGGSSCTAFCGYHNDIAGKIFYAIMPFPGCSGCLGGLTVFNALTGTSSHELCEAITDPVPGKGWYDNTNGEIGDICAWTFKTVSGYNVQKEWSNAADACI